MTRTVQEFWADYAAGVLPLGCPDDRREQLRHAFMTGAALVMDHLCELSEAGECAEDEARQVRALHDELRRYFGTSRAIPLE